MMMSTTLASIRIPSSLNTIHSLLQLLPSSSSPQYHHLNPLPHFPPLSRRSQYLLGLSNNSTSCVSVCRKRRRFISTAMAMAMAMGCYGRELSAAKKAATLAATLCQKVQRSLLECDVQSKDDNSPVTIADYGSQAIVSYILERELASEIFSMVAEEDSGDLRKADARETLGRITELVNETLSDGSNSGSSTLTAEDVLLAIDRGQSEGGPHGRHWVLDPIDGTKGFVRGDQYAIALALLDEGKVVLGVLACPNLPLASIAKHDELSAKGVVGCIFFAKQGCGTHMQSFGDDVPTKVTVSRVENPVEASFFESFEATHSMHDLTSSIAEKLGVREPPVRIDSQAKYGALARGDGTIYMRFPRPGYREKIWDHAAGWIVVTEAGGIVLDAAGKPLDFSKGRFLDLHAGIVATNQRLMPLLLDAVQASLKEAESLSAL